MARSCGSNRGAQAGQHRDCGSLRFRRPCTVRYVLDPVTSLRAGSLRVRVLIAWHPARQACQCLPALAYRPATRQALLFCRQALACAPSKAESITGSPRPLHWSQALCTLPENLSPPNLASWEMVHGVFKCYITGKV